MATPIIELIQNEILIRLAKILEVNGYEFNIQSVALVDRDIDSHPRAPVPYLLVQQTGTVDNPDLSCPGNPPAVAKDATWIITGYSIQHDVDATERGVGNVNVTETQMHAAIQKALADGTTGQLWDTFNGNAIMAEVSKQNQIDAAGHDGSQAELTVTYRTPEGDPFTTR